MIGQKELLKKIDGQIEKGKFPKVSALIGERGSGRTTLAWHISNKLNYGFNLSSTIEDVKKVFEIYRDISSNLSVVYVFHDIPVEVMNLIERMVENIPNNAYIILICKNLNCISGDVKGKAVTYVMEPYSYEDKCDYLDEMSRVHQRYLFDEESEFILAVATNIGEAKTMLDIRDRFDNNLCDFMGVVVESLECILQHSCTDRISSKIAFNGEEDKSKFPLWLFLRAFSVICAEKVHTEDRPLLYCKLIAVTGEALQALSLENDREVFEAWLQSAQEGKVLQ